MCIALSIQTSRRGWILLTDRLFRPLAFNGLMKPCALVRKELAHRVRKLSRTLLQGYFCVGRVGYFEGKGRSTIEGGTNPAVCSSMNLVTQRDSRAAGCGFTFAEVLVAVMLVSIMVVSLSAAFSAGFALLKLARENLPGVRFRIQTTFREPASCSITIR